MPDIANPDGLLAEATAHVLRLGQSIAWMNRVFLLIGVSYLVLTAPHHLALLALTVCWTAGEWFGARVALDHRLFCEAVHRPAVLSGLDQLLGKTPRSMTDRARGALGLLHRQVAATASTLACLLLTVGLCGPGTTGTT